MHEFVQDVHADFEWKHDNTVSQTTMHKDESRSFVWSTTEFSPEEHLTQQLMWETWLTQRKSCKLGHDNMVFEHCNEQSLGWNQRWIQRTELKTCHDLMWHPPSKWQMSRMTDVLMFQTNALFTDDNAKHQMEKNGGNKICCFDRALCKAVANKHCWVCRCGWLWICLQLWSKSAHNDQLEHSLIFLVSQAVIVHLTFEIGWHFGNMQPWQNVSWHLLQMNKSQSRSKCMWSQELPPKLNQKQQWMGIKTFFLLPQQSLFSETQDIKTTFHPSHSRHTWHNSKSNGWQMSHQFVVGPDVAPGKQQEAQPMIVRWMGRIFSTNKAEPKLSTIVPTTNTRWQMKVPCESHATMAPLVSAYILTARPTTSYYSSAVPTALLASCLVASIKEHVCWWSHIHLHHSSKSEWIKRCASIDNLNFSRLVREHGEPSNSATSELSGMFFGGAGMVIDRTTVLASVSCSKLMSHFIGFLSFLSHCERRWTWKRSTTNLATKIEVHACNKNIIDIQYHGASTTYIPNALPATSSFYSYYDNMSRSNY